jgi:hypothetical protein
LPKHLEDAGSGHLRDLEAHELACRLRKAKYVAVGGTTFLVNAARVISVASLLPGRREWGTSIEYATVVSGSDFGTVTATDLGLRGVVQGCRLELC